MMEHQEPVVLQHNPFADYNGFQRLRVTRDYCLCALEISPRSLNPYGMVHGGALYALADNAAGNAARSDHRYYVTQSGTMHFFHNRGAGVITAEAHVRHRGQSTCLVEVTVKDQQGVELAAGQYSFFCVNEALMRQKQTREPLPSVPSQPDFRQTEQFHPPAEPPRARSTPSPDTLPPAVSQTEYPPPWDVPAGETVSIYTDGACSGNPGAGGWAALLIRSGLPQVEISGGARHTTNIRMELTAAVEALSRLPAASQVELYSDSQYLIYGMEKGWARKWRQNGWLRTKNKPALNPDLWQKLLDLEEQLVIRWYYVRGHGSNPYNNRCDALAVAETRKYQ